MDVERSLVSRTLYSQSIAAVRERELQPHHFAQRATDDESPVPMSGEVFAWVLDHVRRYRTVPSMELAQARWPLYQFVDGADDLGALADEMVKLAKRRAGIQAVRHLSDVVDDPDSLFDLEQHFFEAAAALAREVPASVVTRFSDSLNRLDLYKERERTGEVPGVSLVLQGLNDLTYGMQLHEMVIIEAFLGQKKSSYAILACAEAYFMRGQTPLFFSLEMEGHKLAQKWDAIAAGFSYSAAKRLELGEGDLERWYEVGLKASDSRFDKDILVIDDKRKPTEDTIFTEIERWRPDFSVVDTLDEVRAPNHIKSYWEKQDYTARELKGICRSTKKPMLVVAQAGREAEKEGATLGNIAGSITIARKADLAIGIHATPDMKRLHRADFTLLKNRDDGGEGTVFPMYFNPGTMECRPWQPSDNVATKA